MLLPEKAKYLFYPGCKPEVKAVQSSERINTSPDVAIE